MAAGVRPAHAHAENQPQRTSCPGLRRFQSSPQNLGTFYVASRFSEFSFLRIHRLRQAVRVQHQPVACFQPHFRVRVFPARHNPQRRSSLSQGNHFSRASQQRRRAVPRPCLDQPVFRRVDRAIAERDEFFLGQVVAHHLMQFSAQRARRHRFPRERSKAGLQVGHQQCCGDAFFPPRPRSKFQSFSR